MAQRVRSLDPSAYIHNALVHGPLGSGFVVDPGVNNDLLSLASFDLIDHDGLSMYDDDYSYKFDDTSLFATEKQPVVAVPATGDSLKYTTSNVFLYNRHRSSSSSFGSETCLQDCTDQFLPDGQLNDEFKWMCTNNDDITDLDSFLDINESHSDLLKNQHQILQEIVNECSEIEKRESPVLRLPSVCAQQPMLTGGSPPQVFSAVELMQRTSSVSPIGAMVEVQCVPEVYSPFGYQEVVAEGYDSELFKPNEVTLFQYADTSSCVRPGLYGMLFEASYETVENISKSSQIIDNASVIEESKIAFDNRCTTNGVTAEQREIKEKVGNVYPTSAAVSLYDVTQNKTEMIFSEGSSDNKNNNKRANSSSSGKIAAEVMREIYLKEKKIKKNKAATAATDHIEIQKQPLKKQDKKKVQNREAAQRYRQKKRKSKDANFNELESLEDRNRELRRNVEDIEKEIGYLNTLMDELKARTSR